MTWRPAPRALFQTIRLFCSRGNCRYSRLLAALAVLTVNGAATHAKELTIVAAENFYGNIAAQIGGPKVKVTSILNNPDQDPHEFEARPSTARELAKAALVIENGLGYDAWAGRLLSASPAATRQVVVAADLMQKPPGANPHIWYDPETALVVARAIAQKLGKLDPADRNELESRLAAFEQSLKPLVRRIAELRGKYAGAPVTATEPVFGYMATALGLEMRNQRFQLAVMNGTEPSPAQIAAFERDLKTKVVKLMIYNNQTSDALTRRLHALARRSGVPVVGVSETEPPGEDYQQWMRQQLDAVGRALAG